MAADAAAGGVTRASSTSSTGCSRSRSSRRRTGSASRRSGRIPRIYEEAAADPVAWWTARSKELLDWDVEPTTASTTPILPSTSGSRTGGSTRPPSASTATSTPATATASPTTGAARRASGATSPTPSCSTPAALANALKDQGVEKGDVVGIYLPMIPEVAVAMLACARIGAIHNVVFGGFSAESVRERMEFAEAKALVTVDGARRKGKTAPIKEQVDEEMGEAREPGDDSRHPLDRDRLPDDRGPRRLLRRDLRRRRPRVPGRADGGRAPAVHPLHLRLDREAEGDPPHHRRLHDRGHDHPPLRLRPEAGDRRLLVRRRRRLDHRPLLHRLRTALQRGDQRDVGGGAGLPAPGDLVGDRASDYKATILYAAPTAIRTFIKWGADIPAKYDLSARCACSARSASRSTRRPGSGTTR